VLHSAPRLLIMEYVEGDSHFSAKAQEHAAELLAALHDVREPRFGLDEATLIGGLHQPNPRSGAWIPFFREHRIVYMANEAARAGRLDRKMVSRVMRFAEKLEDVLEEPEYPSLLHGDVWTTNVLASGGRITAFLDPAVYAGHPEIELAFITLFGTFGDAFFARYHSLRPIRAGFFEERRDIYNLYPLLVHVRLFGGGYVSGVERVIARYGC
jgi:fructosamine-3-kinase